MISTKGFIQTFDKKYYISDSYLNDLVSIDTELFTASFSELKVTDIHNMRLPEILVPIPEDIFLCITVPF